MDHSADIVLEKGNPISRPCDQITSEKAKTEKNSGVAYTAKRYPQRLDIPHVGFVEENSLSSHF